MKSVFNIVVILIPLQFDQLPELPKEFVKFQGTWRFIGGEECGIVLTAQDAKKEDVTFIIKGTSLVIRHHGESIGDFTFTVKVGKGRGEINRKHNSGRHKGEVCYGIYVFEGDMLKICTASKLRTDEVADRPNVFSTKKSDEPGEKTGKLLFVLKREKQ